MKSVFSRLLTICCAVLLLASCQTAQPSQPTPDVDLIYTQAAATIDAGMKATQAALPTSTATTEPTVTQTPEPTIDIIGTATAQAILQAAATITQAALASPTNTALPPTATWAPLAASVTPLQDLAGFVSLSPARGISIQKNASWDVTVTIKNTGGKTWNKSYSLAYHTGDQMGSPKDYFLPIEVKPGESYTFAFTMTAPADTGKKQIYWAFRDNNGSDMLYIDFDVNVTD